MKKFTPLLIMILLSASPAYSQYPRNQQIQAAEYFLNTDPGEGNGTSITITTSPDITINLNTLDVSVGTRIYVRFKSTNGLWSAPRCIIRQDYFTTTGAAIQYGEYFINTDPGQGKATSINFASGTANLSNQNLHQGDVVYFRIKDSYNRWSPARGFKYQFKEMRRADYKIKLASTGNYTTPLILTTTAAPDKTCPYSCNKNSIAWHTNDSIFIRYQTMEGFYSTWVNGIVADAGNDQTICQGTIATLTARGGQSYQWSDGQAGSSISVSPDDTTTYAVTVSAGPWITSVDSVKVNIIICDGIEDLSSVYDLSVYPNPNNGEFQIVGGIETPKEVSFKVIDNLGKSIYFSEPKRYNGKIDKSINLEGLPSGIYKLVVTIDNKTLTKNIFIKK